MSLLPGPNPRLQNTLIQSIVYLVTADRNDCINVTCQHGGRCEDYYDSYTCHCAAGFTGTHCEQSKSLAADQGPSGADRS